MSGGFPNDVHFGCCVPICTLQSHVHTCIVIKYLLNKCKYCAMLTELNMYQHKMSCYNQSRMKCYKICFMYFRTRYNLIMLFNNLYKQKCRAYRVPDK